MNREVFIIGGGSSLQGFNFSRLENRNTIAVNASALDVPNPTFCITGDSSQFRKVQEGYYANVKTTWVVVLSPTHPIMKFEDGRLIHKGSGFVYNLFCVDMIIRSAGLEGIGFNFNDFKTGYNSGFCAFQLAVLLGYKRIYLLGIDLDKDSKEIHYHDRYKKRRTISNKSFGKFYDNFVLSLKILKEKTDIEVFSCSKNSRLNQHIKFVDFNDLI